MNKELVTKVKNSFTEDGQAAADAVIELVSSMENSETEFSKDDILREVTSLLEKREEEVPEAVLNYINKRFENQEKMETINKTDNDKFMKSYVKNFFASANKADFVEKVKNDADMSAVVSLNAEVALPITDEPLVNIFKEFTETPLKGVIIDKNLASGDAWKFDTLAEKTTQDNAFSYTPFNYRYYYKRMRFATDVFESSTERDKANFLEWVNAELKINLVNFITSHILFSYKRTTTQYPEDGTGLASVEWSDSELSSSTVTLIDLTKAVEAYEGRKNGAMLLMSAKAFAEVQTELYARNFFATRESLGDLLGVKVYVLPAWAYTTTEADFAFMVYNPKDYYISVKKDLDLVYPQYEYNALNVQKEMLCAGLSIAKAVVKIYAAKYAVADPDC